MSKRNEHSISGLYPVCFLLIIKMPQEICPRWALVLLCNGNNWLSKCPNRKNAERGLLEKKIQNQIWVGNVKKICTHPWRTSERHTAWPFINQKRWANFKSPSAAFWQCNKSVCPLVYKKKLQCEGQQKKIAWNS